MRSTSTTRPERAGGFALPTAIFLLVILAALGAFILTVSTAQHSEQALDFLGARANQAARAGIEWGIYQTQATADASTSTYRTACQGATYATPTKQSIGSLSGDLADFKVTVKCGTGGSAYSEGGSSIWVYQIEAIACNQYNTAGDACPGSSPSPFYVERQIRIAVTN